MCCELGCTDWIWLVFQTFDYLTDVLLFFGWFFGYETTLSETRTICTDDINDMLWVLSFVLIGGSTIGYICGIANIIQESREDEETQRARRDSVVRGELQWHKLKIMKIIFEDLVSVILNVSVLTFVFGIGGLSLWSIISLATSAVALLADACLFFVCKPACNEKGCERSCTLALKMSICWFSLLLILGIWALIIFIRAIDELNVCLIDDSCGVFEGEGKSSFKANGVKCTQDTGLNDDDTMVCDIDGIDYDVSIETCVIEQSVLLCYDTLQPVFDYAIQFT